MGGGLGGSVCNAGSGSPEVGTWKARLTSITLTRPILLGGADVIAGDGASTALRVLPSSPSSDFMS